VVRKIKGKDSEQVKSFVRIIDGKLDDFLKELTHNKYYKKKRFN